MTLAVEDVPAKNVQAVEMQNAAARKVESSQQDFGKDVAGMAARPTLGSCPTVCKPASLSLGSMDDAAAAHSNRKGEAAAMHGNRC